MGECLNVSPQKKVLHLSLQILRLWYTNTLFNFVLVPDPICASPWLLQQLKCLCLVLGENCLCRDWHGCIMAQSIVGLDNIQPYKFSDCSKNDYFNGLRAGAGMCLMNKPNEVGQLVGPFPKTFIIAAHSQKTESNGRCQVCTGDCRRRDRSLALLLFSVSVS